MTRMFQTHALELHEIRSMIASSLGFKDLASCACVSQDWNDSFSPPLYNSVVLSEDGPSMASVERNRHFIQHLKIQNFAYEKLSLTSARDKVVSSIMANWTLTTLDLENNKIGDNGAQALSDALKTNSTLTTLEIGRNKIGSNGAQALAEALKINSTLIILRLHHNSIGSSGAKALAEALKTNSTLTILSLRHNSIGSIGAKALAEALKTNSTLTTLDLFRNSIRSGGVEALVEGFKFNSTLTTLNMQGNEGGACHKVIRKN